MTTIRLLAGAYVGLLALLLGAGRFGMPVVLLVVVLALGELWLRALTGEAVPALARIGLASVAGLVSLPFVAIALHAGGVLIRTTSLTAGLAVLVTVLGAVALLRGRRAPVADPRLPRTAAAVALPAALTLVAGAAAVRAYADLPHPPQPGYTSVALNGWAAGIERPVAVPARGLFVPVRVSSIGLPAAVAPLRVRVGDRVVAAKPLTVDPDTTRSVQVYVPAPPDGCLHRIEISLGAASTTFYGHGPARC